MPEEQQPQFAGVVNITLPQALLPLPVALSETRSVDLNDVSAFEMIVFEKEENKKKVEYEAPALFLKSRPEPLELSEAEAEQFKHYWNILLSNSANMFNLIQQFGQPIEQPPAAPPAAEQKQLPA